MSKNAIIVIYVLVMAATVVIVDVLFFRHRFLERLIVNIGIALAYIVFYIVFLINIER